MKPDLQAVTAPKYRYSLVPLGEVFSVWRYVRNLLAPAVERTNGRWTMEHLCASLCTGGQNLWVAYDEEDYIRAALTTQIVVYPNRKMLTIHYLGGDAFEEWNDDFLSLVESYAKTCGCDGVETLARFGFKNFFKRRGYDQSCAMYELSLED